MTVYALIYRIPAISDFSCLRWVGEEAKAHATNYTACLPENEHGVVFSDAADLSRVNGSVLLKVYNFLAETPLKKFDTKKMAGERTFAVLNPVSEEGPIVDAPVVEEPLTSGTQVNTPETAETLPDDPATETEPKDEIQGEEGDEDMAAKKAKAKAKRASKTKTPRVKSEGPREGSKAAKLLALISRPGGATLTEMLNATGWKECRGTALTLAKKAGKTLTLIKAEGKANRWQAK